MLERSSVSSKECFALRQKERERERERMWEVRRTRAAFRKVEHSFDDNERICNHDYIVQDPAVSQLGEG